MSTSIKLLVGAALAGGAIGYLAYVGAANSWQYYLSVDEAVNDTSSLVGKHVRLSGRVAAGSLKISGDRRKAMFDLQGEQHRIHATCRGLMPDNLAENIEVVVEGTVCDSGIDGNKVITRCASKYQAKAASTAQLELSNKRG